MDNSKYLDDPSASASVTQNINNQVGHTNQQIADSYSQPAMAAGRGLLNSHDNFNNGLSFGDQATTAAIKSRYDKQYQQSESGLKLDMIKGAQADHVRNLQVATQAAGQEVAMNKEKAILKWKQEQAAKKARGQVIGTTLGIVGGVVGAIYGGPAGAGAGYALGSGVGSAVGES